MAENRVRVEYHYDFASPNAYLSHLVIPVIERRTGVVFEYVPVLLGGVFKLTGNAPPMRTLAGIRNNPHFPVNTLTIMRGAVYARSQPFYVNDEIYFGKDRLRDVEEAIVAALDVQ